MLTNLERDLQSLADPERAKISARFFKTGKGQYGEGDIFLGITVPMQRKVASKYYTLSLADLQTLLKSPLHECRLTTLFILVYQYQKGDKATQKDIFNFYLKNKDRVNNWDLVDSSAPYIPGPYLLERDKAILYKLANSKKLWDRRIGILSTFAFIKTGQFKDTLALTKIFLTDQHDLMHKATGWMLREIGKRNQQILETFLQKYAPKMPRTMLRYAIEKFPKEQQKIYLQPLAPRRQGSLIIC